MKGKSRGTKVNGLKRAPLAVEISTYVYYPLAIPVVDHFSKAVTRRWWRVSFFVPQD